MRWHEQAELRYGTFDLFDQYNATHGIFTRSGGVSPAPWNSLNLGGTVGDTRENVIENRRRMFAAVDLPVESLYDGWQVHGTEVIYVHQPRPLDTPPIKADILLTNQPDVTLLMRFADCVPIFLFDPARRVIGLVHAGWRGTVDGVARVAVQAMQKQYGCLPGDILAGIGPSICVEHYRVGDEVVQEARRCLGESADIALIPFADGVHFDLWQANRILLNQCGVQQVEVAGICTCGNLPDWYSHRGDQGKTGRFGALLALPGSQPQ